MGPGTRTLLDMTVWIMRRPEDEIAAELAASSGPLAGVRLAVKDNVDVGGVPTTAACPEYAYVPDQDAPAVAALRAAGAVVVGKTNLDQFATGLVGTRSPYGAVSDSVVPSTSAAVPVRDPRWPSPLDRPISRSAPTPPVPAGCRRGCRALSASNRPSASSRPKAWFRRANPTTASPFRPLAGHRQRGDGCDGRGGRAPALARQHPTGRSAATHDRRPARAARPGRGVV